MTHPKAVIARNPKGKLVLVNQRHFAELVKEGKDYKKVGEGYTEDLNDLIVKAGGPDAEAILAVRAERGAKGGTKGGKK